MLIVDSLVCSATQISSANSPVYVMIYGVLETTGTSSEGEKLQYTWSKSQGLIRVMNLGWA